MRLLNSGKTITKNCRTSKTYLHWLNWHICSTGRISCLVDAEYDSRHPKNLNACYTFVSLMRHLHIKRFHQGLTYMLAIVNLKFAVLNIHLSLQNVEKNSLACRKRKAKTISPIMCDLQVERLGYKQAFFCKTGVDYFGPFLVPLRKFTEKTGVLFTCLTTRPVPIEVVPSLDTNSCVMAVRRFNARRGTVQLVFPTAAQTSRELRKNL